MNTFVSHSKFKLFPTHDLRQPTLELAAKRVPNLQQNVAENGRTIQSARLFYCQNPKQSSSVAFDDDEEEEDQT